MEFLPLRDRMGAYCKIADNNNVCSEPGGLRYPSVLVRYLL